MIGQTPVKSQPPWRPLASLENSLKLKQSERDYLHAEIDKANGQLAELKTLKSQLSELREMLAKTASALRESEEGKIEPQKDMHVPEG